LLVDTSGFNDTMDYIATKAVPVRTFGQVMAASTP